MNHCNITHKEPSNMQDIANTQHLHQAKSPGRSDKSETFQQVPDFVTAAFKKNPSYLSYYVVHISFAYGLGICFCGWDKFAEKAKISVAAVKSRAGRMIKDKYLFRFGWQWKCRRMHGQVTFDNWKLAESTLIEYPPSLRRVMSQKTRDHFLKKLREFFDPQTAAKEERETLKKAFNEDVPKGVPMMTNSTFTSLVSSSSHDPSCGASCTVESDVMNRLYNNTIPFGNIKDKEYPPPPCSLSSISISPSSRPDDERSEEEGEREIQKSEAPKPKEIPAQQAPKREREIEEFIPPKAPNPRYTPGRKTLTDEELTKGMQALNMHPEAIAFAFELWKSWTAQYRSEVKTAKFMLGRLQKRRDGYQGPILLNDASDFTCRNKYRTAQVMRMLKPELRKHWNVFSSDRCVVITGGMYQPEFYYDLNPQAFDELLKERLSMSGLSLPKEEPTVVKSAARATNSPQKITPRSDPKLNRERAERVQRGTKAAKSINPGIYRELTRGGLHEMEMTEKGVKIKGDYIPFDSPPDAFVERLRHYLRKGKLTKFAWEKPVANTNDPTAGLADSMRMKNE